LARAFAGKIAILNTNIEKLEFGFVFHIGQKTYFQITGHMMFLFKKKKCQILQENGPVISHNYNIFSSILPNTQLCF
jgi:hypothetical protein